MRNIYSNAASAERPTVATAEAKALASTPSTTKVHTVQKGLKKNNKPHSRTVHRTPGTTKNFVVKSENNKQTSVPAPKRQAAELQRDAEPAEFFVQEESREAKEAQNANAILPSAIIKISEEGEELPVVEQRDCIEKIIDDCYEEASKAWTTLNEEAPKAWIALNNESAKAWESVDVSKAYNGMSIHLTKFTASASHVYDQTAKLLKSDEHEDESEGMEISLTNRVGDTKNLAEI